MGLGGGEAVFQFTACGHCHCRYLAPLAAVDNDARDCTFCRLAERYWLDPRVRDRFPERQYPGIAAALAQITTSAGSAAEPS